MDKAFFPTRTQEPYATLLKREEWLIKKAHIIARDMSKCRICGKLGNDVPLEVHHSFYVEGYDPWEYPDDALITLCSDCHQEWHQNNQIRYAEKHENTWYWVKKIPCKRCDGLGYLPQYDYYKGGICFRCWGERFEGTEQRIRLFTEEKGKTPQEYFDVFTPLTDEEVVRIYDERHQGVLRGRVLPVSYLLLATIREEDGFTKVALIANTGEIYYAFLDSTIAIDTNRHYLNIKTLLYKECMNRNHQKYLIIKGDLITYDEAKEIEKETMFFHEQKK